jgi:hypothetical protein
MASSSLRSFHGGRQASQLAVELRDLPAQVRDVGRRGQVHEVPQAPRPPLDVAPHARLHLRGRAQGAEERPAADGLLEARADGAFGGIERLPEQRLVARHTAKLPLWCPP